MRLQLLGLLLAIELLVVTDFIESCHSGGGPVLEDPQLATAPSAPTD
jgi:hypothetical protein